MLSLKSEYLVCFFISTFILCNSIHFTDVTKDVFGSEQTGLLAAFGDFNSDKLTDVFSIKDDGRTLEILIGHSGNPLLRNSKLSCTLKPEEKLTSVMPGDFNGDSMMDILVTIETQGGERKNQVRVFWGSLNNITCSANTLFIVHSQPLLIDSNGDMIPDIFTEAENGTKYFWVARENGSFVPQQFAKQDGNDKFKYPHSNAFLDLDLDSTPDLLITGEKKIEYYVKQEHEENYEKLEEYDYISGYKLNGQSLFLDIDGNGQLEHIIPVCKDQECQICSIIARSLNSTEWEILIEDFKYEKDQWCFKRESKEFGSILLPMAIRGADLNMDGTPDFIAVLESKSGKSKGKSQAVVIINNECTSCPFGRKLEILWNIANEDNVILAAAYDLYEDGIMDVLLTIKDGKDYKLKALQNKFTTDAYFLKVLVVGGLCYDNCPKNHIPYGTNQPGPFVMYKTLGPKGHPRIGSAAQLAQSAHFPLQLPYTVFGLGQTPNFVDELEVIVPGSDKVVRKRQLTQIIPNSQIVIIPYPPDKPRYWTAKLFVTPSHLVLMTFAALIGTCTFICLIIGILHWKERRQDKKERLLEAHRFHFDAM